jgi:hypothetical protein
MSTGLDRVWSLSALDRTASFETPPLTAPQDEALPHGEEREAGDAVFGGSSG